jgi:hypothetical protein
VEETLFEDGDRRLSIGVSGIDRDDGTVSEEQFGLTVYAYRVTPSVIPIFTHVLDVEGARRLYAFLGGISVVADGTCSVSGRFVEVDSGIPRSCIEAFLEHPELANDPTLVRSVLELNPDLCRIVLETQVKAIDISSLAYRRDQLAMMRQLLDDESFFKEHREATGANGDEGVWQGFFERNQWIFGYGLNYFIGEGVQPTKLEQVVAGYSIVSAGKRVDALLHTRGILRSLCYVEIKTHNTRLLRSQESRPEVGQPSAELTGAGAQSQKTVQLASEHLHTALDLPCEEEGGQGGRFFNYAPQSIVVCGNLAEFAGDSGVDVPRFSSFELYRRSIQAPSIVTFDELYDRAAAIVETGLAARLATTTETE